MAILTRGTTYGASETITNTKLHLLVDSGTCTSIVNADVAANAAIAYSKLNLIGSISDADISSSAAISGSKLDLSSPGIIGNTTPNTGAFSTLKVGTTHQGNVLYDNGTTFTRLVPGTSGQFLQTLGNAANPQWANPTGLGTWDYSSYSADVSYLAATDGFVLSTGTIQGNSVKSFSVLTDTSNPPTHSAAIGSSTSSTTAVTVTFTVPVKKNHYWKVSNVAGSSVSQIYWIPLGV